MNSNVIRPALIAIAVICFVSVLITISFLILKPNAVYKVISSIVYPIVKKVNAYHYSYYLDPAFWNSNFKSASVNNSDNNNAFDKLRLLLASRNVLHTLLPIQSITYTYPITGFSDSTDSTTNLTLYDNCEGDMYTLGEGQISPNGLWQDRYNGYGVTGIAEDPKTGNHYLYEKPKTSTSRNETHASLVITTKNYSNFDMTLDMNTFNQLRKGSGGPNSWEAAWINWRYTDDFHSYALTLKNDGFQIEKKDNNDRNDSAEIFLLDDYTPQLKVGEWTKVRIIMEGTHIRIWINGKNIVDFYDKVPNSPQMSYGAIGLYNEDAFVGFDNIHITPLG
jgi:hypothetical protein